MGSGSSILRPQDFKSSEPLLPEIKQPDKIDTDIFIEVDSDDYLGRLSKQALILKIQEMQSRILHSSNNENNSNSGFIPRSIFSGFDASAREALRAKDAMICQLESELRAQNRSFQNEKVQSQQKLASYASDITNLRFKYNERVQELDTELKRRINSNHQNPLIMKLSQKINEQADIIKELEQSLSRKDEIIEGFKIFESCQYNKTFSTSEESQHNNNKSYESCTEPTSRNSRSFISQDLTIVESHKHSTELSKTENKGLESEYVQSTKQKCSKPSTLVNKLEPIQNTKVSASDVSCVLNSKNLVKLPTNIIEAFKSTKSE